MKTIISTKDCYEGRNISEDCLQVGSFAELYDSTDIDIDSIEWSDSAWDYELDYFLNLLNFEKDRYEKKYKTNVLELVLCGKVGLWNRTPIGGKLVSFDNPISMGQVDDIDVIMDDDRTIVINGYHHDGTHSMGLYFLTESKMKKIGIFNDYEYEGAKCLDAEAYENIYNKLTPVKISKNNEYLC